ncbi:hypothetical protein ACFQ7N_38705 [Streptomyces niveus]|uniref:hypothetical protein n=1 Tax=Streptomyces niveus TaxID=193462 RepID=UPI0036CF99B2
MTYGNDTFRGMQEGLDKASEVLGALYGRPLAGSPGQGHHIEAPGCFAQRGLRPDTSVRVGGDAVALAAQIFGDDPTVASKSLGEIQSDFGNREVAQAEGQRLVDEGHNLGLVDDGRSQRNHAVT